MTSCRKKMSCWALGGAAVVVIAWSGMWFYGARHIKQTIQEGLSQEALGEVFEVHQDLHMGGWPFRFKAYGDHADIMIGGAGGPKISIGQHASWASIWSPNTLYMDIQDMVGPEDVFSVKSLTGYMTWDFWHPEKTQRRIIEGPLSFTIKDLKVKNFLQVETFTLTRDEVRSGKRDTEQHVLSLQGLSASGHAQNPPLVINNMDVKTTLSWDAAGSKKIPVSFGQGQHILALASVSGCFPASFAENFAMNIIDDIEKRNTVMEASGTLKVQDFFLSADATLTLKDRQPQATVKISLKNTNALLKAITASDPDGGAQLHQYRQAADLLLTPMGIKSGDDYAADLTFKDGKLSVGDKEVMSNIKLNWGDLFVADGCQISTEQAIQLLDLAQGEIESGDPARAMTLYRFLADKDIWIADYYMGYMYYKGLGVEKDQSIAESWVKKALSHGMAFENVLAIEGAEGYIEWAKKLAPAAPSTAPATVAPIGPEPVMAPAVDEEDAGSVFAHKELPDDYAPTAQ